MSSTSLRDPRVAVAAVGPSYDADGDARIAEGVRRLGEALGWATPGGGAFGGVIPAGARVLLKPNWVLHQNRGGTGGMVPLVTHGSVIRTVMNEVLASSAGQITIGDAPIQGCDFPAMLRASGLEGWGDALRARDARFAGVVDFRRTVAGEAGPVREQRTGVRDIEHFVLFDLGGESLLEPITVDGAFRVTLYDPELMRRTHAPGRHQYLVAREVIEADVIVNLPKLKTHKKAGVTCALKNLIGINGNKEFLPHHRVGGGEAGGDCYPGRSLVKRSLEHAYDVQNGATSGLTKRAANVAVRVLDKAARLAGDELGVEGSWSGNDTIWRTCLDLNRILLYGRPDGTLAPTPQRTVLNVVDAVVGGQGDGPLAPEPFALGMLLGGASSAAVDWVSAALLGYEPARIPIAFHAFDRFRWPLTEFAQSAVRTVGDLEASSAEELARAELPRVTAYPVGWMDAVRAAPGLVDRPAVRGVRSPGAAEDEDG